VLSPWLHRGRQRLGLEVVLLETRYVHAALKAQRNKTDRNDAPGVVLRRAREERRQLPAAPAADAPTDAEAQIPRPRERDPALAEGVWRQTACSRMRSFDEDVRDAVAGDAFLAAMTEPMLRARAALWAKYTWMHALIVQITVDDAVCKRFMAIPGVGPVTALAFKTAVDAPERLVRSGDVGAHFGLTPKREQSGTSIDFDGHISRQGDKEMRTLLYEAASYLLTRSKVWTSLKALGYQSPMTYEAAKEAAIAEPT
jgi:transposase